MCFMGNEKMKTYLVQTRRVRAAQSRRSFGKRYPSCGVVIEERGSERVAADEKQYFCFRWQSKLTSTSDVFNSMTSSRHSISLLLDEDLLRRGEMFHFCWLCFSVSICVKIDFFSAEFILNITVCFTSAR